MPPARRKPRLRGDTAARSCGKTATAIQPVTTYSAMEMPLTTLLFIATAFITIPTAAQPHCNPNTIQPAALPESAIRQKGE